MKKLLALTMFTCISIAVEAQFTDSTTRLINFSSTGILNKTNEGNSRVLSTGIGFSVKKKSLVFNSGASYIYGVQQGRQTNNDFNAVLDLNLYKTFPNFYYWALGAYDKSKSLNINRRYQAGVGVAYNFVDTETAYVNLSEGIIYEGGNLKLNDSTNDEYQTFRNSLRLKFKFLISKVITLESGNFWQPSLSDGNDYILKSTSSLNFKLYKILNFTTALTYNRLNLTRRENVLLTFGIGMEKYF